MNCNCVGQLIDCEGVAGGLALPGTPCDDMDPNTSGDTYDMNCNCVGQGAVDCEGVPGGPAVPGTACDDMDPNTVGDAYDMNCNCVGSTSCTGTEVTLEIQTDANGNETTWEILPAGSSNAVCSGGPYADNSLIFETCCLPNGCYELQVFDAMGDGMFTGTNGGYRLFESTSGSRIIDNSQDGQFGALSAIANNTAWCLPVGNDRLAHFYCDRFDYDVNDFIVLANNPLVAAEFGVGAQNDDGFQYWIFDPDGSFNRFIFLSHANPSIGAPPGPFAVNHLNLLSLSSVQAVPQNIRLNVRVRSRVNGVNSAFGPACVFMVDPVAANDPCNETTLHFDPNSQFFSCGVTRTREPGQFVTAFPVPGANRYQFEYSNASLGYLRFIAYPSYNSFLSWGTLPLIPGNTYDVRVRASSFGGSCEVTIVASNPIAAVDRSLSGGEQVDFDVYPNPNRGEALYLTLGGLSDDVEVAQLIITDMFGRQVHQEQVNVNGGAYSNEVLLDQDLAQGMYLVSVQVTDDEIYTLRLVRQ